MGGVRVAELESGTATNRYDLGTGYVPQEFEQLWQDKLESVLPKSAGHLVRSRVLFYPFDRVCQEGFGYSKREDLRLC